MQALFKNMKEDFRKYNKISRYIITIGTAILIILLTVALAVKICILTAPDGAGLNFLYEDLLECIKESFGAIYLSSFGLEILHLIYNREK